MSFHLVARTGAIDLAKGTLTIEESKTARTNGDLQVDAFDTEKRKTRFSRAFLVGRCRT